MPIPCISVLLPVHNAAETLTEAVESIRNQSFTNWELILADDGSTDNSAAFIRSFEEADPRIRSVFLPKSGIVKALNEGFRISLAPLIARMDADDISYPGRLEKQFIYFETHPGTGLLSCCVDYGGDRRKQEGYASYVDWINRLQSNEDIYLNQFIESPIAHPTVMFRRAVWESHGGYREGNFPEDYELWLRWIAKGVVMEKLPDILFRWNDPPNRLSRTHEAYSAQAFQMVRATYLFSWLEKHNPFHPKVVIWGAGRRTRQRLGSLLDMGVQVQAYIDVSIPENGHTHDGIPVVHYSQTGRFKRHFILSCVSNRGVRSEIRKFLINGGRREGKDFIMS